MVAEKIMRNRDTAKIICIKEILDSEYYEQGGWDPNYILSGDEKIFRINLMAIVISKSQGQNNTSLIIEDKTGQIMIRMFEEMQNIQSLQLGDIVTIIGKPREFSGQKYFVPEVIKSTDMQWYKYRLLELEKIVRQKINQPIKKESNSPKIIQDITQQNNSQTTFERQKSKAELIYESIKELDNGQGVDISLISEKFPKENIDEHITGLISQGDVFEIKKGKLKVLE